jgi:acetyltransferase
MENSPIPVLPMFTSLTTAGEKIDHFRKSGRVYFQDEVSLAAALATITRQPRMDTALPELPGYDKAAIAALLNGRKGGLGPDITDRLLEASGFKRPALVSVMDKAALSEACNTIGFPLAVKVIGPLHKSDVGGVRTGVADIVQARDAYDHMMKIQGATGVMLQAMVTGTEMILGAIREEGFGHLIMFGLGGIYTEVLKDIRFALAPLTPSESLEMIQGIKSFPILEGVRGQEMVNIEKIADNLQRLGLLVTDFPQIKEMDLNPLKGTAENLYAVDARIIIDH